MQMSHRICAILIAAALTLAFSSISAVAQQKGADAGDVAIVNDNAITRADFDNELNLVRQRLMEQGRAVSETQLPDIQKSVLQTLINRELLFQESRKKGIKVEEKEVQDQIDTIKQRFPNEAGFETALQRMNLSIDKLRSQIHKAMAIKKLVDNEIAHNIDIPEKESKAYYDANSANFKQPEQVKASHILIKVEPKDTDDQKAKAREQVAEIQKKLKDGGDFAALAKEYSQGPSSAKGGDLGYFKRGQMVKPFEEAAFALSTNEVSDIVETRFGYHLIKVYDKTPERTIAYEEVKPKLVQSLKQEKTSQEIARYVEGLEDKATIERRL